MTEAPGRCQACGYAGGALALRESAELLALVRQSGAAIEPTPMWVCAAALFAEDGAAACLQRMVGARNR